MAGLNQHELKGLQTQRSKIEAEISSLERERGDISKKIELATNQKKRLTEQINKAIDATKEPIVSEHAMLRYLEKMKGVDLEEVKRAILTQEVIDAIDQFGNGSFPNADGFRVKVQNRVIVTVIPNDSDDKKSKPKRVHVIDEDEWKDK